MAKEIERLYPFGARLYRQFETDSKDDINTIMSATKMNEDELKTAYYNEVNVNGENGIHSDPHQKWPPTFENGKIFYVPTYMALNRRRNHHEITIPKIPMRFLYKKAENENEEDEPMRNRYILFWECDAEGKFSSGSGIFYGRDRASKPVGLGTTDGEGFLKGESLSWISDGDSNSINCTRKKKFDHMEEKILRIYRNYNKNNDMYYGEAYSTFKHRFYTGFNPLYDSGNGNFIWSQNVSRFIDTRNYAFLPLPIDIFPEKSISTIDLTTIAQDYLKITVPGIGTIPDYRRTFYLPEFLSSTLDNYYVKKGLGDKLKKREIFDVIIDQKDFKETGEITPKEEILYKFKKDHKTEAGFKLLGKKKKYHDSNAFVYQIEISEKTPPVHEDHFAKLSLPEWIARINQYIKETEAIAENYLKRAKSYTDIISQLGFVRKLSKLAAQFPYGETKEHIKNDALTPLLITTDLAEAICDGYVKQVKKCKTDSFKDKEFKKADKIFEKKATTLLEMISNEDFAKEIVYYFNLKVEGISDKKPADWKYVINFNSDIEKKDHLSDMAVKLHEMFQNAYSVIKTTDIFDIGSDNKNSAAWKAYTQVKKAYNQVEKAKMDKSPFGIVLFHTVGATKCKKPFDEFVKAKLDDPFMQSVFAPSMLVQIFKLFGKYFATDEKIEDRLKPIGDTIVNLFKKLQFENKKRAKTIDRYKNEEYESGKSLVSQIDDSTKRKYSKSINMSCNGIVFILTFMNLIDNFNSNKDDGVKQAMVLVSDVLDMYDTGTDLVLGFFKNDRDAVLKGTQTVNKGRKLIINSKVFGTIGCLISASIAVREMNNATDSKAKDKACLDLMFALVSLAMVFGPGGWVAGLIFAGVMIAARAIIDSFVFGGPVEQNVYNLCKDLEKGEGFILLKEDTPTYTKYRDLLELTRQYKRSNKELSWRAVGPLISMGYIVMKGNKKKQEIDYEKSEELIKKVVKDYPEYMYGSDETLYGYANKLKVPKVGRGYTIKEILNVYDDLYKKSLLLKPKERISGKNQVMTDLKKLKEGRYVGETDGKRIDRFPLRCSKVSLEGSFVEINDPNEEPTIEFAFSIDFLKLNIPKKKLELSKRNDTITIYDIFYHVEIAKRNKYEEYLLPDINYAHEK